MNFNAYSDIFENFNGSVSFYEGVSLSDVVFFCMRFGQDLDVADFEGRRGNEYGTLKFEDINEDFCEHILEEDERLDFSIFKDSSQAKRVALEMLVIEARDGFEAETQAREAAEEGYDF